MCFPDLRAFTDNKVLWNLFLFLSSADQWTVWTHGITLESRDMVVLELHSEAQAVNCCQPQSHVIWVFPNRASKHKQGVPLNSAGQHSRVRAYLNHALKQCFNTLALRELGTVSKLCFKHHITTSTSHFRTEEASWLTGETSSYKLQVQLPTD